MTTSTDLYLNSIRLVGFCGAGGINWAIVTRMKETGNPPRESFHGVFPKECLPILHYMRPQFRFLIYFGRNNTRVNMVDELDRFFYDMEKVVSGDASVWGAPVVIDGVHILPEVECLVPSWLRQEFFARTSDLGLPAGQHYVFPGVRSPLLLPTDYIRKYSSIYVYIYSLFIFNFAFVVVFKTRFFNVTAVSPVWTDQRFYAMRLGGHVLSRHFRYYIPEFSGQIVVQTPIIVR